MTEFVELTRSSQARFWDLNGFLALADVNEIRIDHDPLLRTPIGVLVEPQRTNLLKYSNDFSDAVWTKTGVTATQRFLLNPLNETATFEINETATNSEHKIQQAVTADPSSPYAFSGFVKHSSSLFCIIEIGGTAADQLGLSKITVNLSTGAATIINGTGGYAYIKPSGRGYFYFEIGTTTAAVVTNPLLLTVRLTNANKDTSYLGATANGVIVFGMQFEKGNAATSYIHTTSATVTRSADLFKMPLSNLPFIREQGSIQMEFHNKSRRPRNKTIWCVNGDGGNEYQQLRYDSGGSMELTLMKDGVQGSKITYSSSPVENNLIEVSWNQTDLSININGNILTKAITALPINLDNITLGSNIAGSEVLAGHLISIRYATEMEVIGVNIVGQIVTTNNIVSGDAQEGDIIGTLSVLNRTDGPWYFSLSDNADSMFSVDGNNLVVGATPLDPDAAPSPIITVTATYAGQIITSQIQIQVLATLPTLPLPMGTKIPAIGDGQIGVNGYYGQPIVPNVAGNWLCNWSMSTGPIEWARCFDPRFDFDSWYDTAEPTGRNIAGANQGIYDAHLKRDDNNPIDILIRLPALLAQNPKIIILQGGMDTILNGDVAGGTTPALAAEVISKLDTALIMARSAGTYVILISIFPRADWPVEDARHQTVLVVNQWIRDQVGREGVFILDVYDDLAPGDVINADLFQSGSGGYLLNQKGAYFIGRTKLLPLIQSLVASGSVFDQNQTVDNLFGTSVGNMEGTAGTKGSGITGNVATGFGVTAGRNITAVCQKDDMGGGLFAQRITFTPTNNNNAVYSQTDLSFPLLMTAAAGINPGDWVRSAILIKLVSQDGSLGTCRLNSILRNGSTTLLSSCAMFNDSGQFAIAPDMPVGSSFWLRTNPFKLPTDVAFDRFNHTLNIFNSKFAHTFTLQISKPIFRKVADPTI